MHERDSWAGVNGQVTKERHPRMWMSFQDCLELYKLTVFSADAAERQLLHSASGAHAPEGYCATAYLANGSVE